VPPTRWLRLGCDLTFRLRNLCAIVLVEPGLSPTGRLNPGTATAHRLLARRSLPEFTTTLPWPGVAMSLSASHQPHIR
jgi:hypothetical protein